MSKKKNKVTAILLCRTHATGTPISDEGQNAGKVSSSVSQLPLSEKSRSSGLGIPFVWNHLLFRYSIVDHVWKDTGSFHCY